jgi:hypothetical protein
MHRWYAAAVATTGLAFQVLVLEPWHQRISDEIRELKEMVAKSKK